MCDEAVARRPYTLKNVPDWFLENHRYGHGMMIVMMNLLSCTKVIKNERQRKHK